MKWNYETGNTKMVDFPIEETKAVLEAAGKAAITADLKALLWCVRRMVWLYGVSGTSSGGDEGEVDLFNRVWAMELKNDPPPESVKDLITRNSESEPGGGDGI